MLTPLADTEKVQAAGRGAQRTSVSRQAKATLRVMALVLGAFVVLIGVSGCGEAEGVADGATVTAYVEASLCSEARRELQGVDGRAGDLKLQAICLSSPYEPKISSPYEPKKLNLATVGANARRATEDSTAVAFLEAPDPRVARFTRPILKKAEIPWIVESSGSKAMSRLLKLIEAAGSGSLRAQIRSDLNQG